MMRTSTLIAWVVALAIGNAGCGAGELSRGSCRQTIVIGASTATTCTDYNGLTSDQSSLVRSQCSGNSGAGSGATTTGIYSDSMCDKAGSLGGCRAASGSYESTVWYFPGSVFTVDIVRSTCMQANLMYVTP